MTDLSTPLTEQELEFLDSFLLERIDADAATGGKDEGVVDISGLDGFFTAIICGPVAIAPSQWLPVVWGDFEPVWESEEDGWSVLLLMLRHMNSIAEMLMDHPALFEPLYYEREIRGKTCTIVDDWCEGFTRGMILALDEWEQSGREVEELLAPIVMFTSITHWRAHDLNESQVETLQQAIAPNVRKIHAHWLARRPPASPLSQPARRAEPRVGRNDPCPCGSGKKYKKCCLQ